MIGPGSQQRQDDRTPPMTPQLALRVAVIGGVALVLFAIVFFRLWSLQVLNSNVYANAAARNIVRKVPVEAQRGEILDRTGQPLVESAAVPSVSISPTDLPVRLTNANFLTQPGKDKVIYRRLARVLGMSDKLRNCTVTYYGTGKRVVYTDKAATTYYNSGKKPTKSVKDAAPKMSKIGCLVAKSVAGSVYGDITIKTGVSADIRGYIDENQSRFQGVLAGEGYQRRYLLGTAGAQLFGYVGPLTAAEEKEKKYSGVNPSDSVGQDGLEGEYDQDLRGTDGYDGVKVNADNQFEGYAKGKKPKTGNNLKLSLSAKLEKVGYESLAKSVALNKAAYGADGGAFVAMDPVNGSIYAMGSYPSYKPSIYNHGLSEKEVKYLDNPNNNDPLVDKAIAGAGPDGSTFKVITATAALESGVWGVNDTYDDTGQYCIPGTNPNVTGDCVHNSGGEVGNELNLISAFEMSDDDFFFNLGYHLRFNPATHPNGGALEQWARKFGLGQLTGVDLPGEIKGTVPTPKLLEALYKQEIECENATGPYKGDPKHPSRSGGCGISNLQASQWGPGDDINTALGQGDLQVTPLQLAVVYAAIENGGKIVTPHLAQDVQTASGTVSHQLHYSVKRDLDINPLYLQTIQQGLYYAANGGYEGKSATSSDVMGNFGSKLKVYGKTGTAQYGTTQQTDAGEGSDYAWYACYVPSSETSKPIVVVVWVQKGSFGDIAAAPVARQILSQWFYGRRGPYKAGTNATL